jgi:large subunit ribosomal protein L25
MKTILLKGEKRAELGTRSSKEIRRKGQVPCVMYSEGNEGTHFAIYQADFKKLVYTQNAYKVRLDIEGEMHDAVLQDIQFHPVSEMIIHADFLSVSDDKPVVIEVPINVVGNSPGVRAGGKLVKKINRLKLKGLLKDMPDYVDVEISKLEIGQSAKVRDISVENIEIIDAPANAIVSVKTTRALMQAAAAEAKEGNK